MIPALPRAAAIQLIVIRTAFLLGLLLFGAATWYVQRRHNTMMLTPDRARFFGYLFCAIAALALAGLLFLRTRLSRATQLSEMIPIYMIGYALAEGAALFGGVVWYMGGARDWFIAGLVLMVVSFQVLPVPRPRKL